MRQGDALFGGTQLLAGGPLKQQFGGRVAFN